MVDVDVDVWWGWCLMGLLIVWFWCLLDVSMMDEGIEYVWLL